MEQAVIDRFEGDYAVVLVGDGQRHMDIARQQLPPHVREGDWLRITFAHDQIVAVEQDVAATEAARQRIAAKLERLRRGDHLRAP